MRSFVLQSFCGLVFCALLLCGCSSDGSKSGEQGEESSMRTPLADDEVLLQRASEQAIARFAAEMMAALTYAVKENGPSEALSVCNVVAPDIAVAHAKEGWFLSRITDKPRNSSNRADENQKAILARFAADSTLHFIAQWDDPETKETFHYYKPIRTGEICLQCHGTEAELGKGVREKLAELYPDDEATGYELGDLRGMFAVEVIWPEGRKHAESLIQPEG
jgi:hypothetical protein